MKRILSLLLVLCTVVGMLPALAVVTAAETTATPVKNAGSEEYWQYYVQDGLTMLLTAYDADNETLDLAAGTWKSRVGTGVASLVQPAGTSYWQAKNGGRGIGYDLTLAAMNNVLVGAAGSTNTAAGPNCKVGLDMGLDNLPEGDFTLEVVTDPHGMVEEDGTLTYIESSHYFMWYAFSFGCVKGWGFPANRPSSSESHSLRWVGMTGKYEWEPSFKQDDTLAIWAKTTGTVYTPKVITWSASLSVTAGEDGAADTAVFVTGNGINASAMTMTLDGSKVNFVYTPKSQVQSNNYFYLFYGMPADVYAIRVYDRVLTAAEKTRNHAVDMLGYYGIRTGLSSLYLDSMMDTLLEIAGNYSFTTGADYAETKAALQAEVDEALAAYDFTDEAYLSLYVQDGLSILLSAWSANPTVNLSGKKWASQVNGKQAALTGSETWTVDNTSIPGVASGITFSSAVYNNGNGVKFDYADLPEEAFTLEYVFTPRKLTGVTAGASGVYNTFSFGPMKAYGWPGENAAYTEANNAYTNLGLLYYYSTSTHENANTTVKPMWCVQDPTLFRYNGKTISYGVTYQRSGAAEGEYTARYDLFRDGTSTGYGLNVPAASYLAKDQVDAKYQLFTAGVGYPSTVYAVRLYTRVLSAAEMAWNHAVDVMAYYRLDVPDMSDALRVQVSDAFADVALDPENYAARKAALQETLSTLAHMAQMAELYVQDGLTVLLTAFGADPMLNLAGGKWTSRVGTAQATLAGTWTAQDKGGISYSSATIADAQKYGITLDIANLPDGNFTVETVAAAHGLRNADGSAVTFTSEYGISYPYTFAFGPFKGYGYPAKRADGADNPNSDPRYCSYEVMWYYAGTGSNFSWLAADFTFNTYLDTPVQQSVTASFTESGVSYGIYANAALAHTVTKTAKNVVSNADSDGMFRLFSGFPATVYAVRVYDRVLGGAEMAWNHAVDVMAYYDLSPAAYLALPEGVRKNAQSSISAAFAEIALGVEDDGEVQADAQQTLDSLCEEAEKQAQMFSLYVQDGLTALFDAYGEGTDASLTSHTWIDRVGGSTASLGNITGGEAWFRGEDGGIGYRLTPAQSLTNTTGGNYVWNPNTGLSLDTTLIPAGSYTVESVVRLSGVTTEDGNRYGGAGGSGAAWLSTCGMAIGPLKGLSFPTLDATRSQAYSVRWNYLAGAYDQSGNFQDYSPACAWDDTSAAAGYAAASDLSAEARIITYTVRHELSYSNGALSGIKYEMFLDAQASAFTQKTYTADKYIAPSDVTAHNYFRLFCGWPVTYYAVRVYDRALSVAERRQNHFADLVRYLDLDIYDVFAGLTESKKQAVYEKCATLDFDTEAETVQGIVLAQAYDTGLYVTDGLLALFTAFDSRQVSLSAGTWKSVWGDCTAALQGKLWTTSGGGLGYGKHFDAFDKPASLTLPVSLLSGDFTVRITADVAGVREDNGGKLGDEVYMNRTSTAYTFGNLQGTVNITPANGLHYASSWSIGGNVLATGTPAFTAQTDGVRTFGLSRTGNTFSFLGTDVSFETDAFSPDAFTLFDGNPATVYSIAVYNRELTEAEELQNHFADLAGYYGLNLAHVLSKTEEERAALYERFADLDFSYTQTQMEAIYRSYCEDDPTYMLEAAMTYDGLSARLNGEYGGIRSLYVVDHRLIDLLEKNGYRVAYGGLMGIGSDTVTTGLLQVSGYFTEGYKALNAHSAAVTVYGTECDSIGFTPTQKYVSVSDGTRTFAYTVVLDAATDSREYYEMGICFSGFITANNGVDGEHTCYVRAEGSTFGGENAKYGDSTSIAEVADYFVNHYTGSNDRMYAYWSSPRLNAILEACEMPVTRTVEDEKALLATRTAELEARMASHKQTALKVCGRDTVPAGNTEKYIWLQWMPEYDYAADTSVRAAFLYYPMDKDPSAYTDEELAEMGGVVRTFCYIGVPGGDFDSLWQDGNMEGIVLTHGGGGHAYASYVAEALAYGYVAIAMDTEGAIPPEDNKTNGMAGAFGGSGCVKDTLGHKGKDSWVNSQKALEEQWMYYAVSDVIFCNTVLRTFSCVDENKVGMTGISWGGVITSCTIGFDDRLAFSVPVYCGYDLINCKAGLSINAFAAALWQPEERMRNCTVPTLVLTSQKDMWASLNNSQTFFEYLGEYGYFTIKTNLGHSQSAGASPMEIYRFGHWVNGGMQTPYGVEFDLDGRTQVEKADGRSYTLHLTVPEGLTLQNDSNWAVQLVYTTEGLTYASGNNGSQPTQTFYTVNFTPYEKDGEWYVDIEVPEEAYLYYIAFRCYSKELEDLNKSTPNGGSNGYKGYVWTSTDVVVIGGKTILQ